MALLLRSDPAGGKFLYVVQVPDGTPAHAAGIAAGDLILAIDGRRIIFLDQLDLLDRIAKFRPGDRIRLRLIRGGKERDIRLTVGTLPEEYESRWSESLEHARQERSRRSPAQH